MKHAAELDGNDVRLAVQNLKRERIVMAAVELFYKNGFSHTSLDAVAGHMGVTKPFIYAHFKSKKKLLGEICSRAMRVSLEGINYALGADTPTKKLELFAHELMKGVLLSGKHLAIYMREEKSLSEDDYNLIRELRREVDEKLVGILKEGMDSGDFNITDPKLAALAIGGIGTWLGMRLGNDTQNSAENLVNRVVPLVMAMVGGK